MNKLKECRIRAGLSQKEVALSLGIKGPSVSLWESGENFPSVENLIKLADLYHVTVDELLGRVTEKEARVMDGLQLDERQILTLYRQLTDDGKLSLFGTALSLQNTMKKE